MIHKIHTGTNLTSDYTVYGFGGSVNNFNDVTFPGDRRDCSKCHVNGSEELPLSAKLLPVTTPRDTITITPPQTAACLGCHTAKSTAAHAVTKAVTHVMGRPGASSVDKVHAR